MRKTVGSKQLAVGSEKRADSGSDFVRSLFSILLIAVFAFGAGGVSAQNVEKPKVTQAEQASKQAPPADAEQSNAERRAASLVTEFDVNGMKVLVKRRAGSQTVAAGLFLRGGSRNITAENAGIESLMLDVATEASLSFPRERLRTELSRMGTVLNASENYDYSVLSLTSTRANFDRSWEIFTDVALRPAFTKEDFALVQSRKVSALRDDSDDPDTYLQRLQERVAYAGHPYLNRPQGTAESVARLNLEDVRKYHQQMMQTSRLLLVVVGDLDPAQVRASVAASFGKLPRGTYASEPVPQLTFAAPTVEVTQRGLPTNYIQGLFTAPALTADDIHAMQIASSILRDRVFEEVRVKRNLSYAPNAFLNSQGANVGGIYVTAVDANKAVRVMLDEIKRLQTQPIDQRDITGVISQFLTTYYLSQETNAAQAGNLAEYELIGGGWLRSFDMLSHLRAVSPADVQRVAQKYMRNIRFVVIGDPQRIDKSVFTSQTGE
ncbi:MAG: zinc protease [Acidobacteriota bacterium]|jgi:predicted Zn-dependent peptidase|nr:zinc protease [Acidobacteriota bacterium]